MAWFWTLKDFLSSWLIRRGCRFLSKPRAIDYFICSPSFSARRAWWSRPFCRRFAAVHGRAVAAHGMLHPLWLFVLLSVAAIVGDTVNYWIGAAIGPRAFSGNVRFLKKEHLERTHRFYEKYGGLTIILAASCRLSARLRRSWPASAR